MCVCVCVCVGVSGQLKNMTIKLIKIIIIAVLTVIDYFDLLGLTFRLCFDERFMKLYSRPFVQLRKIASKLKLGYKK